MTTAVASPARKSRVSALLKEMRLVPLSPDHPAVDKQITDYRMKFGLGPRVAEQERAQRYVGMEYHGEIVAVFGDRREGRTLEITDAYFDGSRPGKIAFAHLCYAYRKMLDDGDVDSLVHTVLAANVPHWTAIVRETGDWPAVLVFVHKRKAG